MSAPGASAWAPGSAFVVLSVPSGRETYVNKYLVRVDPASGGRSTLAEDPRYVDLAPAVSPDGRLVAFARGWAQSTECRRLLFVRWRPPANTSEGVAELWAVRPDGSGARRLITQLATYDIGTAFGYYGAFRWRELFAVAPG